MADEKPKEGVKTENNGHLNLKVAGPDGSVVQFKIKRHTPLKLMKAYCEQQDTPAPLDMEDEDTMDVFQQQTGGVFSEGACSFPPELSSYRPRTHSLLETTIWFHHLLTTTM
ncbi:small ubiquitin-related modifier 2-like [Echinops telfairi]|uniref:Small ubiquitin-related modifier 2-like n=1 Tax=Echinops telfairi TaxID=9371 RepID=A0ABM0J0L2_ECHTE|nr:small ubiquitin-related modifier 2-like [Echinops telfairi]